ncbi:predicted protein, partial [Nematostella vectensis]
PKITLHPEPTVVREGKPLILTCVADGRPSPSYTWILDGQVIQDSFNGTVKVERARREDAGSYRCVANNSIGSQTSRSADVTV